jgi:hypothetical protein
VCRSRTLQVEGIVEEGRFGAGWKRMQREATALVAASAPCFMMRVARLDGMNLGIRVVMVLLGYVVADIVAQTTVCVWVGRCCTGCVCVCVCSYDLIL